ncbi:type IIL restriction-modification enzyme MmeI, partial [Psychrobacter sp. 1U2]
WRNNAKHNAGVHVVIIGLSALNHRDKAIYKLVNKVWHSELVDNISPYLISGSNTAVIGLRDPVQKRPKMLFGNKPTDGGFLLLENHEKEALERNEPFSSQYIKKVVGAKEFLHSEQRWCLWFEDADLNELYNYRLIKERLDGVKKSREESKAKSTRDFAKYPHLFRQIAQPKN